MKLHGLSYTGGLGDRLAMMVLLPICYSVAGFACLFFFFLFVWAFFFMFAPLVMLLIYIYMLVLCLLVKEQNVGVTEYCALTGSNAGDSWRMFFFCI